MNIDNIKMLLVQARKDKEMMDNEYECFLASSGLSKSQLTPHNLLEKSLNEDVFQNFDCLAIGGSGDFSVLDEIPNIESLEKIVFLARENNFPVLGACLGGQFLAKIFGGKVVRDDVKAELGTYTIYKTKDGKNDPLLISLSDPFFAQEGHNDSIYMPPRDAIILAEGEICKIQAFRIKDTKIYGFQFHPELDKKNFLIRLEHHKADYANSYDKYNAILNRTKETTDSSKLVGEFINKIVLKC